ncbi:MAG: ATP-binding protein, partial [Lachnospiraceae bacterium]|nr:ATP-binding protein [Lachnospiraceae bacterium]
MEKKQAVEHKKVKSWLKSVSAFANTAGGTLIFGITDAEEIVGLEDIKSDSEFISQKIKERISPFPEVVMMLHKTEDGKELLMLHVPSGAETPYYYTGDGVTEAYIRIGNGTGSFYKNKFRREQPITVTPGVFLLIHDNISGRHFKRMPCGAQNLSV